MLRSLADFSTQICLRQTSHNPDIVRHIIKFMDPTNRDDIKPGLRVKIVLKQDQPTGKLTEGIVEEILTPSPHHPRGIKVRLADGQVGRVQEILK